MAKKKPLAPDRLLPSVQHLRIYVGAEELGVPGGGNFDVGVMTIIPGYTLVRNEDLLAMRARYREAMTFLDYLNEIAQQSTPVPPVRIYADKPAAPSTKGY
jgi:hypothetical protein